MMRHRFIEGVGIGILAGAVIGLAAASPSASCDMRRVARRATRRMERMKDDLSSAMGM